MILKAPLLFISLISLICGSIGIQVQPQTKPGIKNLLILAPQMEFGEECCAIYFTPLDVEFTLLPLNGRLSLDQPRIPMAQVSSFEFFL